MGNGSSILEKPGGSEWWVKYCRQEWRSTRVKQLDELLGLQRPPIRRGQSWSNLEELVRKLTQDPIPLLNESEDNNDLKAAIAKLNSGSILHTEKRAIERLLAQRYEDALALAQASAEQANQQALGGASEVLRKVLTVLRHNSLDTELDRSGSEEVAEWRVRNHRVRRRAFLVVRSMVRLKREVGRLAAPIHDLGWLLPVAAQERWGELKALAAKYRQLEATLQDTEVAISQLTQLRGSHSKALGPNKNLAGGRGSPQRMTRGGPRIPGSGTPGRAVSESGAASNSRGRPRTMLTADPPPPPPRGGGGVNVRRNGDTGSSGPASAPLYIGSPVARAPLNGKKAPEAPPNGNASPGLNGNPVTHGGGSGPLVPTLLSSPRTPTSSQATPLSGLYNTRLSVSGGSINTSGLSANPASSILTGMPSLPSPGGAAGGRMSAPGGPPLGVVAGSGGGPPGLAREPSGIRPVPPGNANRMRSSFSSLTGVGPMLPSVARVAQILDLTVVPPSHVFQRPFERPERPPADGSSPHSGVMARIRTSVSGEISSLTLSNGTPTANGVQPHKLLLQAQPELLGNGGGGGRGGNRIWGVTVEPSPPSGPPPSNGARRPLGPLSHSSPAPLPTVRRGPGDGGDGGGPPLPVLIQDGETLDQALARFKLQADDTRGALVDTARQFRAVLDQCNSAWPDQRWWLPASVQEEAALDTWTTTDEYVVNRADIVRCLKAGLVVFQFLCYSDEPVEGPTGNRFDWWTSDPWEVAADLAPDRVAEMQQAQARHRPGDHSQRLMGWPLGVRILQQLANSVAEAAGPLALDVLPIVLHISERQQEIIAADLLQYGVYRRLRRNLFLVVQRSHPVWRYNAQENCYDAAEDQPQYTPGSGFSMLQLLWPGHALFLNEAGELERLPHSLMDELRSRNTEWFVSRTCQDLSLLTEDGALDMRSLTHVSYMWNTPHMRYSCAVEAASTYVKHRDMILQHGSVLLCRKPKVSGMVVGRLDGAVRVDRYGGPGKAQLPVVELMACELNSAHMQHELTQIATARATATSVGVGRYVFRFEVLSSLLTGPTVLRPKLLPVVDFKALSAFLPGGPRGARSNPEEDEDSATTAALLSSGPVMLPFPVTTGPSEHQLAYAASRGLDTLLLRVHLSMSDLTVHHAAKVVALKAHRSPIFVKGPQDGSKLVELLTHSDHDLSSAAERLAAKLPSFARQQKAGQNILVFVQDNSVSLTATNVAAGLVRRERGDRIHLVTVVPTEAQRGEGAALLERLLRAFRMQADVITHVMSQEGRGLLECVADVVASQHCGLLLVGSTSLTALASAPARNAPLVLPGMAGKPLPGTAAAGGGGGVGNALDDAMASELLVSSVALSILRTFSLPVILVTANTRTYLKRHATDGANGNRQARLPVGGVGGASSGCLAAMAVVERHSRPMMHHLARYLLEPSLRQDTLTLTQLLPQGMAPGNAGYDASSIQTVALKTIMANFESIAAANDFHNPSKVFVQGEWQNALCAAARDHGAQLLCVQLVPGSTKSLPPALLQLVRSAPCPVLVYPERVIVPGSDLATGSDSNE